MKSISSLNRLFNMEKKRYILIVFFILIIYLLSLFGTALSSANQELPVHFDRTNVDVSSQALSLANPSFEIRGHDITGWRTSVWSGNATIAIVSNVSRTGSDSVLVSSVDGASAALVTAWSHRFSVFGGETYAASVWAIASGITAGSGVIISLAWYTSSGSYINTVDSDLLSNSTDWTHIFVNAEAPQNAVTCQIELHLFGQGSAYFDDVTFAYLPSYHSSKGQLSWNITNKGIANAHVATNTSSLLLEGDFTSSQNEQLTYVIQTNVNTKDYTLLKFNFVTSTANNAGLLITFDYSDGTKIITYGPVISNQLTTVTLDPRQTPSYLYYLGNRPSVPGKQLSAMEFTLDDWPDSVNSGNYSLQVSNVVFYRSSIQDDVLMFESGTFLLLALLIMLLPNDNCGVHGKALIGLGASIALVAAASRFLIPISLPIMAGLTVNSFVEILGCSVALIGLIPSLLKKLPTVNPKNDDVNTQNCVRSSSDPLAQDGIIEHCAKINWLDQVVTRSRQIPERAKLLFLVLGLVLIPAIGFLLRLNSALVLPLFDDEVSRYITAWGLLHGQSIGLNLAGPWDPTTVAMLKTGIYTVSQWPSGLPIPYASTVYYPTFYTVSPFIEPFMTHILVAPILGTFGFSAITLRLPFILLSLATNVVVFFIASRRGNFLAGLIASAFFAVTPYIVHYGSQAFEDNAVMLFYALAFYCFLRFKDAGYHGKWLYVTAAFAALSCLSKIGAFFAPVFFLVVLFLSQQVVKRQIVKSVAVLAAVIAIYPIVGLVVSPKAFVTSLVGFAQYNQVAKGVALSGAQPVFNQMALLGSVIFGFICVVYLLTQRQKDRLEIGLGVLSYLLILLLIFTYAKEHYFLAVMPLLAVAIGLTLASLIKKPRPLQLILIMTVFVFTLQAGIMETALFLGLFTLAAIGLKHKTPKIEMALSIYSAVFLFIMFSILVLNGWQYTFLY
jgi:hypothetical protein